MCGGSHCQNRCPKKDQEQTKTGATKKDCKETENMGGIQKSKHIRAVESKLLIKCMLWQKMKSRGAAQKMIGMTIILFAI